MNGEFLCLRSSFLFITGRRGRFPAPCPEGYALAFYTASFPRIPKHPACGPDLFLRTLEAYLGPLGGAGG